MKRTGILVMVLVLCSALSSTALFVIDEYTGFQNFLTIETYLDSTGLDYTAYNIGEIGLAPSLETLSQYPLVIWYCSYSNAGLAFWNTTDSDNPALVDYLNGGGHLWVIGTDVLFDRYGVAPVTFETGSFPFAYLGLASYNCQSHADDGETGVPQLIPTGYEPLIGLPVLNWIYPTSWYVDGVTPAPGAVAVYEMGPESYLLHGQVSAVLVPPQETRNGSAVMGFYFDPYEISSLADADSLFSHVADYFLGLINTGNDDSNVPASMAAITNYPNPFNPSTRISYSIPVSGQVELSVYNLKGQKVATLVNQVQSAGQHTVTWNGTSDEGRSVPSGVYFSNMKTGDGRYTVVKKMILLK